MTEMIIQIIGAFFACIGFSIIYQTKRNRLFLCGLSAALAWAVCCLAHLKTDNIFLIYFTGAAFVTLFSEILARITKAPATIYLIPGILPMVPGGSLYYTTYALVTGDSEGVGYYGERTILAAVGIAFGLVVVSVIMYYYNGYKAKKVASK